MHSFLIKKMKEIIDGTLPENFGLIFDGGACDTTEYMAIFASFPLSEKYSSSTILLSFGPLKDQATLSAVGMM